MQTEVNKLKKRVLCIGLVLALATTIIMPATAIAKKVPEYIDTGVVTSITPGEIKPAGNSDRWVVKDRSIEIDFDAISPEYGLEGIYTLTYHANVLVDIEQGILQAGNLQGVLSENAGDNALNIRGTTSPALPESPTFSDSGMLVQIHSIEIDGRWTYTSGDKGSGTFDGEIWVVICIQDNGIGEALLGYDLDGHVVDVVPGPSLISLYN